MRQCRLDMQVATLAGEKESFRRQLVDLRNTVEAQEARMEGREKEAKSGVLTRLAERRSLRKKRSDKVKGERETAGAVQYKELGSPLETEARGLVNSFAQLNQKVCQITNHWSVGGREGRLAG